MKSIASPAGTPPDACNAEWHAGRDVSALYVGYTTGFQHVMLSPGGLPVERTSVPSLQVGRQVFAKLSYLIQR